MIDTQKNRAMASYAVTGSGTSTDKASQDQWLGCLQLRAVVVVAEMVMNVSAFDVEAASLSGDDSAMMWT